jgi:hypothetical protein
MRLRGRTAWWGVGALLAVVVTLGVGEVGLAAPATGGVGAPGMLWGRLAVEEESPEGAWTPLAGVEINLYPYTSELAGDLEQIRRRARDSGADYDTAVAQLQDRLKAYAARLEAESGGPVAKPDGAEKPKTSSGAGPSARPDGADKPKTSSGAGAAAKPEGPPSGDNPAKPVAGGPAHRQATTDSAGLFVFGELPPGEWLVVAFRLTEYTNARAQRESTRRTRAGRESTFTPQTRLPAKQAEVWLVRVRVEPDERVRLSLTERSRFMVGPIR